MECTHSSSACLAPAKGLHGQAGVPDLGHALDLVALEEHGVHVVGGDGLACRRARATLARVRALKNGKCHHPGTYERSARGRRRERMRRT